MSESPNNVTATDGNKTINLRRMNLVQLKRIDNLLEQVGEFGELRLIVEKGAVRFVEVVVSKRL